MDRKSDIIIVGITDCPISEFIWLKFFELQLPNIHTVSGTGSTAIEMMAK